MVPHGFAQKSPELPHGFVFIDSRILRPCGRPIGRDPGIPTALPDEHVSGGQLAHALKNTLRIWHVPEREIIANCTSINPAREPLERLEGAHLGREREPPPCLPIIEGLDAEAIPGQHQLPASSVPQDESEHAAQVIHHVRTVVLVQVHERLCVAAGREPMTCPFKPRPNLPVVVDLTIEDDL